MTEETTAAKTKNEKGCPECGYRSFISEVRELRNAFVGIRCQGHLAKSPPERMRRALAGFCLDVYLSEPIRRSGLEWMFDRATASALVEMGMAIAGRAFDALLPSAEELLIEQIERLGESLIGDAGEAIPF